MQRRFILLIAAVVYHTKLLSPIYTLIDFKGPYGLRILPQFTRKNGIISFWENLAKALRSLEEVWRPFRDAQGRPVMPLEG